MRAAAWPSDDRLAERLLLVDRESGEVQDRHVSDLPELIRPGDMLVVNDAATLPASLSGRTKDERPVEVRLVGRGPAGAWTALLFGSGDWRTRTEDRPAPPKVRPGESIRFDDELCATVRGVSRCRRGWSRSASIAKARPFWSALYRAGGPCSTRTSPGRSRSGTCRTGTRPARGPSRCRPPAGPSRSVPCWSSGGEGSGSAR